MRAALQSTFDLGAEETDELVQLAEAQSKSAASLYEFTSLVDAGLDASQKKRIVELLWLVTFADGRKDAHEEHLVRRIAGLLHVPHPDFIDAKRRARERSPRISAPAEPGALRGRGSRASPARTASAAAAPRARGRRGGRSRPRRSPR